MTLLYMTGLIEYDQPYPNYHSMVLPSTDGTVTHDPNYHSMVLPSTDGTVTQL